MTLRLPVNMRQDESVDAGGTVYIFLPLVILVIAKYTVLPLLDESTDSTGGSRR
jgi:hypothetical protein